MKATNLLPIEEQEVIKKEKIFEYLRNFLILSSASYLLVMLFLFGGYAYLKQNLGNLDGQITQLKVVISKKDNDKLKSEVNFNNASVLDYNKLADSNPKWSNVLSAFAAIVPDEVKIKTFNANTKSGKIDITGRSRTRDAVLELRKNILASTQFKNIDLPLDNLQQPTNLNFHYTFYLTEGALK